MRDAIPDFPALLGGRDDVVLTDEYLRRTLNLAEAISRIVRQQAVARMKIAMQRAVNLKHDVNGLFDLFLIQFTVSFRVEVGV